MALINSPLNYFENDIEQIRKNLEEKKEKLNLKLENASSSEEKKDLQTLNKEIIKQTIKETYPVQPSPVKKIFINLKDYLPNYLKKDEKINEEIKIIVEKLIDIAINKGIQKAIKESLKYSSFIQDAFHDALVDKIIPFLEEKNKNIKI